MAKSKMKRAKSATLLPAARWALHDGFVQRQMRAGVAGLLAAYGRISGARRNASMDKRAFRRKAREVAVLTTHVLRIAQEPPPAKNSRRNALLLIGATAGVAVLIKRARRQRTDLPIYTATPSPEPPEPRGEVDAEVTAVPASV